jgi:hypothetical protein
VPSWPLEKELTVYKVMTRISFGLDGNRVLPGDTISEDELKTIAPRQYVRTSLRQRGHIVKISADEPAGEREDN